MFGTDLVLLSFLYVLAGLALAAAVVLPLVRRTRAKSKSRALPRDAGNGPSR